MAEDFDQDYDELDDDYEEEQARDPYLEINELKQKLGLLQRTKEAQRARYKKEMHMIVNALIIKHKELQKENHFLQQQVQQLMGEGSEDQDFLADLKDTISEQKKEVSVLRKMVQNYQGQDQLHRQEQAELEALQELIEEKDQFITDLEDKNQEFIYQLEAKDGIIARISSKEANLEAEVYAMNKRIRNSGNAQDQSYLDEMKRLKDQIAELEEKKVYYQNIADEARAERETAFTQTSQVAIESQPGADPVEAEAASDEEYEEAMDMLLHELQENLSTYDQISSQFSKARV